MTTDPKRLAELCDGLPEPLAAAVAAEWARIDVLDRLLKAWPATLEDDDADGRARSIARHPCNHRPTLRVIDGGAA
jgi:hypothetical protein